MLQFIQYLKGYVRIRVWGYSPERFMNLCSNHDIFLWDIENHGEYHTMCITVNGFKRLKPIVKKTGTKVAIQKRCGLPFFIPKIKRRKIFIAGLAGSIVFWMWMSTFIWAVELDGNYTVSNDVFMDFLDGNDIYVGMKKKNVNIESLEKEIRRAFHIVTWTSAKLDGTKLEIQIKENEVELIEEEGTDKNNKEEKNEYGSDLVAQNDGIVVNMVTRKGVPQVAVNAEVKAGDILVSGSVPIFNEDATVKKYQYYDADADVFIRRKFHRTEELPLFYKKKEYTGNEKKEYFIALMPADKEIKLRIGKVKFENYDKVSDKKQIKLLENFYLPVSYGSTVYREYREIDYIYGNAEVKTMFSEKLNKFVASLEQKGVQIIKKNVTISKKNKKWQMNMDLQIEERTGKSIPIVPELTEESIQDEEAGD